MCDYLENKIVTTILRTDWICFKDGANRIDSQIEANAVFLLCLTDRVEKAAWNAEMLFVGLECDAFATIAAVPTLHLQPALCAPTKNPHSKSSLTRQDSDRAIGALCSLLETRFLLR